MSLKTNRTVFALIAIFAIAAFAACATSSTPTATPEPSATETPTPEPITAITVDPSEDPVAFLNALPRAEVTCASSAVGGQSNLIRVVGMAEGNTDGVTSAQLNIMATCFSDKTIASVALGQLELETGGLSDSTRECVNSYAASIDFTSFFDESTIDPDSFAASLQTVFCLNGEERTALEQSAVSIIDLDEMGGIDALECAVDAAGPNGLADLALFVSDESGANASLSGQFIPIMIDCGIMTDADFEDSGLTAAQLSCLFSDVDEATIEMFFEISANPDATPDLSAMAGIMASMTACGIDAEALIGSYLSNETPDIETPDVPSLSTETLICLTDNGVSADLATDFLTGQADPNDPTLAAALEICVGDSEAEGVVVPDGQGGTTTLDPSVVESLPFTIEQVQCIVDEVGVEQLEGLANGTTSPIALIGALTACDIQISDLANL